MQLKNLVSDLLEFARWYPGVAVLAWLLACPISYALVEPRHLSGLVLTAMLALAVGAGLLYIPRRYDLALQKRIDAGAKGPVWEVDINDVRVGEIRDDCYATIQRNVYFDMRIYTAQLLNLASVVGKLLDKLLQVIPVGIFWLAVVGLIFDQKTFFTTIYELQMVTPEKLMLLIPAFVVMFMALAMLYFFFQASFGHVAGYVNHFDAAIGKSVRRTVRCAAEGKIFLQRMDVNQPIGTNEPGLVESIPVKS